MEILFHSPKEHEGNFKATIQNTGKLGFTEAAIKRLKINEKKGIKLGYNKDDPNEKNLYVILVDELDDDSFRINKAGPYYYINTKGVFDKMQLDYVNNRITFDIVDTETQGQKLYKFIFKQKSKK